MRAQSDREKVAVLGGGPAAIAAAFQLTDPALNGRFEVTIYQQGWRLGGKCASGRSLDPQLGHRIEEHGLHVWFGFYDNSFALMRRAYEELKRPPNHPLATLEDAFKACDEIVLYDRQGSGWEDFDFNWPTNDKVPGRPYPLPDFWEIASEALEWAIARFEHLRRHRPEVFGSPAPARRLSPAWFFNAAGAVGAGAGVHEAPGGEHLLQAALQVTNTARKVGTPLVPRVPLPQLARLGLPNRASIEHLLATLLRRFRDWLWERVVRERCDDDPDLRLFFTTFDLFASATAGIVEDGVLKQGWEKINDLELCDWLEKHGAKPVTIGNTPAERSPVLRAIYDTAFGYPGGDIDKANVAAGTAMNDLLRLLFTYRGSVLYKMQAGMGDTVFTPFYEVLAKREVKFEFFHAVTDLRLSPNGALVKEIEVVPQVQLLKGHYDPLIPVHELQCWPSEPLWDQLREGAKWQKQGVNFEWDANPLKRTPKTLEYERDFHHVVLGIPVGALPEICGEIAKRHKPFARMLESAVTVNTQAFQLWMNKKPTELGYPYGENSVCGCYVEPIDTWCDMTHLIPREDWPASEQVKGIAYFCGVLEDRRGEDPAAATERVKQNTLEFLKDDIGGIWPRAVGRLGAIDWSLLVDPGKGPAGPGRLSAQYWRANTTPSERYVLTPAGSVKNRLAADKSGVDNLMLAGDWTLNGIDGGCVEAAVTSGMQAARALSGETAPVQGESPTWLTDETVRVKSPCDVLALCGCGRRRPAPGQGQPDRLPPYVEFGGRATTPPPFSSTEGSFQGLLLEGDAKSIDDLCRRMLTEPARGKVEYRPLLGKYVLLFTGTFGKVTSLAKGFDDWGSVAETQISLWVPVMAGHRVAGIYVPRRLCLSVPYILVNNPMSYAGGREDYGYPKSMGRFKPDSGLGDPVRVEAFGGDFAPENVADWQPLLELSRPGRAAGASAARKKAAKRAGAKAQWHEADMIPEFFRGEAANAWPVTPDASLLEEALGALLGTSARQVFLKQFRDAEQPGRACYQAIVEAPIQVIRASWRPTFDDWLVTINRLDSHPIARELGVETQTTCAGFELKWDMIAQPGTIVAP
jgi:uncharacterized protein with NAD-binding domain and iron-sulfur cluster